MSYDLVLSGAVLYLDCVGDLYKSSQEVVELPALGACEDLSDLRGSFLGRSARSSGIGISCSL